MNYYLKTLLGVFLFALAFVVMNEVNPFGFAETGKDISNFMATTFGIASLAVIEQWGTFRFLAKITGLRWAWYHISHAAQCAALEAKVSIQLAELSQLKQRYHGANAMITALQMDKKVLSDELSSILEESAEAAIRADENWRAAQKRREQITALCKDLEHARRSTSYYKGQCNRLRRKLGMPDLPSHSRKEKAA